MQTLAPGRLALIALLLPALAGCAHHGKTQYPPSDAFFNNPPPEGVLTPAQTGPGDRPPPRKVPSHESAAPAAAAPAAAAGKAATPAATTTSAAGGAAAGT